MGLATDSTAGPGITNMQRLKCIGSGWDNNIVRMFIRHLGSNTMVGKAKMYLAELKASCSEEQFTQAEQIYKIQQSSPKVYGDLLRTMASTQGHDGAAKVLALPEFYEFTINAASKEKSSILDSGAARHVHPETVVTDPDSRCRLTSFTGQTQWTDGNGFIPLELYDELSGKHFDFDIEDSDAMAGATSSLLSLCKLLRKG